MQIGRLESKLSSDLFAHKNRMTFVIRPFNLRRERDSFICIIKTHLPHYQLLNFQKTYKNRAFCPDCVPVKRRDFHSPHPFSARSEANFCPDRVPVKKIVKRSYETRSLFFKLLIHLTIHLQIFCFHCLLFIQYLDIIFAKNKLQNLVLLILLELYLKDSFYRLRFMLLTLRISNDIDYGN